MYDADFRANRLLAALPDGEYSGLLPHLAPIPMDTGVEIYAPGAPIRDAYFPLTGVASTLVTMADGAMIETGTIGNEGFVGLAGIHGGDGGPLTTVAQVPGIHARIPIARLREACATGSTLNRLLNRFSQAFYVLAAQSAACNRLHPVEERCARWLLLTHDRAGAPTFQLTHEYLGYMLGVRRASVSLALSALQRAGLITYHRGDITVLNRSGLESVACECYATIAAEYDRLIGAPRSPHQIRTLAN
jgi:CRP-like cAMP-binding protein